MDSKMLNVKKYTIRLHEIWHFICTFKRLNNELGKNTFSKIALIIFWWEPQLRCLSFDGLEIHSPE